jgi:phosphinothricin acetyltransferase
LTIPYNIRPAEPGDLRDIVSILNPYIVDTAITFDTEPYTDETRKAWFGQFRLTGRFQCFVAESEGKVVGYANSSHFKPKRAYDTSVEVSIYKSREFDVRGVGSALYNALFLALAENDVHRAYAYITLPNDASLAIHQRFGFEEVGLLTDAGRKFDHFHTVMIMEKSL